MVPQDLLDCYVHMISPEGDINRHCAHNFPAVAFTVGRNNWPCIMGAYVQLSSDVQVNVAFVNSGMGKAFSRYLFSALLSISYSWSVFTKKTTGIKFSYRSRDLSFANTIL